MQKWRFESNGPNCDGFCVAHASPGRAPAPRLAQISKKSGFCGVFRKAARSRGQPQKYMDGLSIVFQKADPDPHLGYGGTSGVFGPYRTELHAAVVAGRICLSNE